MKKVVLFSPNGYIGGFIREGILGVNGMELYEITRDSDLKAYKEEYDILVYSASVSCAPPDKYINDNVAAAVAMMNFCKEHRIKRVIYLSSDQIYGELNTDIATERAVMINPSLYGISKYMAERIIMESGISYFILRMPGVVGRTWGKTLLYRLMDSLKKNEDIQLYNYNRMFNNVLDIDDLVRFIILLCDWKETQESEVFLLGNTEKLTLKELVLYIRESCHSTSCIKNIDTVTRRCFTLDVGRAMEYGYFSKKIKTIVDELYRIQE